MYTVYILASYLLTTLLLLYLLWRSLHDPEYRRRWRERFALSLPEVRPGGIVLHAASVGEVNAASALIRAILLRYPASPLLLTCFTPTGSARIRELFGAQVAHAYIPLDLPGCTQRFFRHAQPRLLIIMETEIWPNLYHAAAQRNIPILLANARISDRSFARFLRTRRLIGDSLQQVGENLSHCGRSVVETDRARERKQLRRI